MLYPNHLTCVLLFDRRLSGLGDVVRDFVRIASMRSDAAFQVTDTDDDRFYRLADPADSLSVRADYIDRPANAQVLQSALASAYTAIVTPDIRNRVVACESHVMFSVGHDPAGEDPDPPAPVATQTLFEQRLANLALISRIMIDHAMPVAVHWGQSDTLISGAVFDDWAARGEMPGVLHIHPHLFGPDAEPGAQSLAGFRTQGAANWLGREVIVQPNVLPWTANLAIVSGFVREASRPGAAVPAHGSTLGTAEPGFTCRILHHEAGDETEHAEGGEPLFEIIPVQQLAPTTASADGAASGHAQPISPAQTGAPARFSALGRRPAMPRPFGRKVT